MTTYPMFYGSTRKTIEQVEATSTFSRCHPQMRNRLRALLVASGGHVGIGTAWRSSDVQRSTFLARHAPGWGNTYFEGQRWHLLPGNAPAAPPGLSFHETLDNGMGACAVDLVGDLAWAAAHAHEFDLVQATWGNELWHFQPLHDANGGLFPHSVSTWKSHGRVTPLPFPGTSLIVEQFAPVNNHHPVPTLRQGDTGDGVRLLQRELSVWAWETHGQDVKPPGTVDGQFGPTTKASLKSWQRNIGSVTADGVFGPVTSAKWNDIADYLAAQEHH